MYNEENTITRPSGLRQPSRIPATASLSEMSCSDTNARSMLPPPSTLKHKATSGPAPEPAPKRKTLAERAGEGHKSAVPQTPSRLPGAYSTKTSNYGQTRPNVLGSSSSRMNGLGSRNVSNGSSHSASSRPPSRSQSSMSLARGPGLDYSASMRANTALGQRDDAANGGVPPKRQGTTFISSLAIKKNKKQTAKGSCDTTVEREYSSLLSGDGAKAPGSAFPRDCHFESLRKVSLSTAFQGLNLQAGDDSSEGSVFPSSLDQSSPQHGSQQPKTPSHIPVRVQKTPKAIPSSPSVSTVAPRTLRSLAKSPTKFLSRGSNLIAPAWDTEGRLEDMETLFATLKAQLDSASKGNTGLEESLNLYKIKVGELEQIRTQLTASNQSMTDELSDAKVKLSTANLALEETRRNHTNEIDDLVRKHRNLDTDREEHHRRELDRVRREEREELDRLRKELKEETERLSRSRREELAEQERLLRAELEEERSKNLRQLQDLTMQHTIERQTADADYTRREREVQELQKTLATTQSELDTANSQLKALRDSLAEAATNALTMETSMNALRAKIEFLESDNQAQSQSFADLHQKMQDAVDRAAEAQEKLRIEETLRRKLHNQVQELKGNIRVFCRVRPTLDFDTDDKARIVFPDADTDHKEVGVVSEQKSATGNVTTATSAFSFDRVFSPAAQNAEVFEEISQLIQSALDGYNVCIFCYGQTGSGKTYTMSSTDGMIPRAVKQIYDTAKSLEEKGWTYKMEGSFIEVYNDTLNDLLGKAEDWEKKKHEIKHDPIRQRTTVTDVTTVQLDSPDRVISILDKAGNNRSVAATKANARSSRSHSVFILKLTGENKVTGEKSEGTLNLVDLAGSERLNHSGATGDRMKETQHINKSLACLGDVIGALGQGKEGGHVPYRNSKLTYLLQYSLGGNSKTLMFVMISPLQAHLSESLTSLKFATKVHNTHIGTARRTSRV